MMEPVYELNSKMSKYINNDQYSQNQCSQTAHEAAVDALQTSIEQRLEVMLGVTRAMWCIKVTKCY